MMLSAFMITACSDDDHLIIDYVNYDMTAKVVNQAGEDLLDPQTSGNIIEAITVEYKGQVYENRGVVTEEDDFIYFHGQTTRATLAQWCGLRVRYSERKQCYLLHFGEFDTAKGFKNESFIIHWGDGTSDTIMFDLYPHLGMHVRKGIHLNGHCKSEEEFLVEIVK